MTPYEITLLIHFHVSPALYQHVDAPIYQGTVDSFLQNDLIEQRDGDSYHTTERGEAHIEQLCKTDWPIRIWANKDGEVIKFG